MILEGLQQENDDDLERIFQRLVLYRLNQQLGVKCFFPSGCDKNQIAVEKDFEIDFQVCFSGFIYISAVAGNIASLDRLTRKEE